VTAALVLVAAGTASVAGTQPGPAGVKAPLAASVSPELAAGGPIRHVVVVFQENHSFDNVLGAFCVQKARCDGTETGVLAPSAPGGSPTPYPLVRSPDVVPFVGHRPPDQELAVDGGRMDGWSRIPGCSASSSPPYGCLTQYQPGQVPNLVGLATQYALSDRTFEPAVSASWGSHLELASSTLDGFTGANPDAPRDDWGCGSRATARWRASPGSAVLQVPSCVPNRDGSGAFEPTPVRWVPTIMDRLDAAGLSWRIYAPGRGQSGYGWSICPSFADCLGSGQSANQVPDSQFASDAIAGRLPSLSVVVPMAGQSQHNRFSMALGDNWIGAVVNAVATGPDWSSTAVFITYDDCGCFYDHVPPPPGEGVRVPMVIVSPWAKPGFTDSTPASFDSLLAFCEHVFGLAPLSSADAGAYDYAASFNLPTSQPALAASTEGAHFGPDVVGRPAPPVVQELARGEARRLEAQRPDPEDPT